MDKLQSKDLKEQIQSSNALYFFLFFLNCKHKASCPRHAIRMSAGNSFLWETCGPNVFRGEYHDSFPIDLMCKDTQLGYEMARNAKVNLL